MCEGMNTAHLHNEKPTPFRFILNYIKPKGCGFFLLGMHHCLFSHILLWICCSGLFLKKSWFSIFSGAIASFLVKLI